MDIDTVQIIDTGVANIRSLQAALTRLGRPWNLTVEPDVVLNSETLILPGVGTFGAAMAVIDERNLRQAIVERVNSERRTLAICLGLQLLCSSSEESEEVEGLGVLPNRIRRFSNEVQVPQLGWNRVVPDSDSAFQAGEAYFANSFRLADEPVGWSFAKTCYDGEFISSFWRSKVLACQFHPELSGEWGQQLIADWLEDKQC